MTRVNILGIERNPHLSDELKNLAEELRDEMPPYCDVEITLRPESKRSKEFSLSARVQGLKKNVVATARGWNLRTLAHMVINKVSHQLERIKGTRRKRKTPTRFAAPLPLP